MEQSKEGLVELILDKMTRDMNFSSELHHKLSLSKATTDEIINEYERAIKNKVSQRIPDVDFFGNIKRQSDEKR